VPMSAATAQATGPMRVPVSTGRAVLNTIKGSAANLVEWYEGAPAGALGGGTRASLTIS
jgi:hypothetical protein